MERRQLLSAVSFGAVVHWTAGAHPADAVAADFNGDGRSDVAVVNPETDTVNVLISTAGGAFAAPLILGTGHQPLYIAAGDINNDGRPDLAVSLGTGKRVDVLLNKGGGQFATAVSEVGGVGPGFLAIADVTGDGHADIVVTNPGQDTLSVLPGKGNGVFAKPVQYPAGNNPQSFAIGDFNGDGHPDLAVANPQENYSDQSSFLSVMTNDGGGGFSLPASTFVRAFPQNIVVADFNEDGKLDLAVKYRDNEIAGAGPIIVGRVSIMTGDGTGAFAETAHFDFNDASFNTLAVADFNGDGHADLAVPLQSRVSVGILTGTGTGDFTGFTTFDAKGYMTAFVVADFNTDGRPDLAWANNNTPNSNVSVLLNTDPDEWAYDPADPNLSGRPSAVPGTVRFQNYDIGGEGVAFHDSDKVDSYNVAARGDGVDVSAKSNGVVGYVKSGEWLKYTVNVAKAGSYHLSIVAGDVSGTGGTFHVEDGAGGRLTAEATVPARGIFSPFATISLGDVPLTAGRHTLKFQFDTAGAGSNAGEFVSFTTTYLKPVPVIGSFTASPNPVTVGTPVTLTAGNVTETDGTVKSVNFLRESNGIAGLQTGASGDVFVAADNSAAGGWTATLNTGGLSAGAYTLYAQATDAAGVGGAVISTSLSVKPAATGASMSGTVYLDSDQDGTHDASEAGLGNLTVWLDLDGDKTVDAGEPTTTTAASGAYTFSNVAAAGSSSATRVRVRLPAGYTQVTPGNGFGYSVTLTAGATNAGKDFGLYHATANSAAISGYLFNDTNKNGAFDGGESVVSGRQVWLDLNDNGVVDAAEPTMTSDAAGKFDFEGLAAGTYHVRRVFPAGYAESTPPRRITLTAGQAVTGVAIGSKAV